MSQEQPAAQAAADDAMEEDPPKSSVGAAAAADETSSALVPATQGGTSNDRQRYVPAPLTGTYATGPTATRKRRQCELQSGSSFESCSVAHPFENGCYATATIQRRRYVGMLFDADEVSKKVH
jgi:hypothetical protein